MSTSIQNETALTTASATSLARAIRGGEVSSVEVVETHLRLYQTLRTQETQADVYA